MHRCWCVLYYTPGGRLWPAQDNITTLPAPHFTQSALAEVNKRIMVWIFATKFSAQTVNGTSARQHRWLSPKGAKLMKCESKTVRLRYACALVAGVVALLPGIWEIDFSCNLPPFATVPFIPFPAAAVEWWVVRLDSCYAASCQVVVAAGLLPGKNSKASSASAGMQSELVLYHPLGKGKWHSTEIDRQLLHDSFTPLDAKNKPRAYPRGVTLTQKHTFWALVLRSRQSCEITHYAYGWHEWWRFSLP